MPTSSYRHPHALIEGAVGPRTRVWAWAHVMDGATVGEDCNIGEHCFVERGASLGDRVTLKNGVSVWEGVQLASDVFVGPGAVFTNDARPRSRAPGFVALVTRVEAGATIGAHATILPGLVIGHHAFVGAAALVTRDVPPHALVLGQPARVRGYVCDCARNLEFLDGGAVCPCGRRFERGPNGGPVAAG